jgi:putative spermidine/putrescine transport system substrate-binding protein
MRQHANMMSRFLLAAISSASLTVLSTPQAVAADLTVTAYGGSWEAAYRKCFVQPFEKTTGKTVDVVLGSPTQWANQIAASPAKPPIDVVIGSVDSGKLLRERGLVDALTPTNVPNVAQIDPKLLGYGAGHGFPLGYGNFGLMYNTKTVKNPPKSWKEFVDETVKGTYKVALPGIAYVGTTQGLIALFGHVYGGSIENVQPGLDQIKRMRDSGHVTFYSEPNSPLVALRSGEIDMAMYFDGRAWAEYDAGTTVIGFTNPAPGTVSWPSMAQKVKNGSPLGFQFMDMLASAEGQACFANAMQYPASNMNVKYSDKLKPRIAPADRSLWISFDDVAKNAPQWIEAWNKQIGR